MEELLQEQRDTRDVLQTKIEDAKSVLHTHEETLAGGESLSQEVNRVLSSFKKYLARERIKIENGKGINVEDTDREKFNVLRRVFGEDKTDSDIIKLDDSVIFSGRSLEVLKTSIEASLRTAASVGLKTEENNLLVLQADYDIITANIKLAEQIAQAGSVSEIEKTIKQYQEALENYDRGLDITLNNKYDIAFIIAMFPKGEDTTIKLGELGAELSKRQELKLELDELEKQPVLNAEKIEEKKRQIEESNKSIKEKQSVIKPILKTQRDIKLQKLIQEVKEKKMEEIDKPSMMARILNIISLGRYSKMKKQKLERTVSAAEGLAKQQQSEKRLIERVQEFRENIEIINSRSRDYLKPGQKRLFETIEKQIAESKKIEDSAERQKSFQRIVSGHYIVIKDMAEEVQRMKVVLESSKGKTN